MHRGRTETRARLLIAGCFLLAYLTLLLLAAAYLRRCPCEQAFQALESSDPQTRAYGIKILLRAYPEKAHGPITIGLWALECDTSFEVRDQAAFQLLFYCGDWMSDEQREKFVESSDSKPFANRVRLRESSVGTATS